MIIRLRNKPNGHTQVVVSDAALEGGHVEFKLTSPTHVEVQDERPVDRDDWDTLPEHERAAIAVWNQGSADTTQMLKAVRAAVDVVRRSIDNQSRLVDARARVEAEFERISNETWIEDGDRRKVMAGIRTALNIMDDAERRGVAQVNDIKRMLSSTVANSTDALSYLREYIGVARSLAAGSRSEQDAANLAEAVVTFFDDIDAEGIVLLPPVADVTREQAEEMMTSFDARFPKFNEWLETYAQLGTGRSRRSLQDVCMIPDCGCDGTPHP